MKGNTDEFSFILKPSEHGIGVFTTHGIQKNTLLRLFGDSGKEDDRVRNTKEVPERFRDYTIVFSDHLVTPKDFGAMAIGWYMNHSKKPNAVNREIAFYALRDINEGEEITIDYNGLGEPEEVRDLYYF